MNNTLFEKINKDVLQSDGILRPVAVLIVGSQENSVFELDSVNILGREDDCQIVVNDTLVSRHHLKISVRDLEFVLEDLNSTNGSYYQNEKFDKIILPPSSEFVVGKLKFKLDFLSGVKIEMLKLENKKKKLKKELFSLKNVIKK